jgi:hypothetical protein
MDDLGINRYLGSRGADNRRPVSYPLPVVTQADVRSGDWVLTRGINRPMEFPMPAFAPQVWDENLPPISGQHETRLQPQNSWENAFPILPEPSQAVHSRYHEPHGSSDLAYPYAPSGSHADQGAAQPRKGKKHVYSEAQWEERFPKIRRLYVDDDMKLEDTMAVVAREDDFHPS